MCPARQTSTPLAIADPYKAVAVDVAALKANPQLPGGSLVTGLVYDVTIGQPGGGPDVLIECQCGGSISREKSRMLAYSVQGRFVNAASDSQRLEDPVRFKDFLYLR
jgi:hypothetical protein